jgi:hypothetical protein
MRRYAKVWNIPAFGNYFAQPYGELASLQMQSVESDSEMC